MGLAMLSESLVATEAARGGGAGGGQQQPQAAAGAASIGDVKASLAAAAGGEAGGKRRKNQPAVQARPAAGPQDELDELEGASSVPAFQLTFGEQGTVRGERGAARRTLHAEQLVGGCVPCCTLAKMHSGGSSRGIGSEPAAPAHVRFFVPKPAAFACAHCNPAPVAPRARRS